MLITDCFGYGNKGLCLVLREQQCEGCRFYKTAEQVKTEREKAKRRIESLSLDEQMYLEDKYGNLKFN